MTVPPKQNAKAVQLFLPNSPGIRFFNLVELHVNIVQKDFSPS